MKYQERVYPNYTRNEVLADGVVHVIGVLFGITALSVLLAWSLSYKGFEETLTLAVYGSAMVLMFVCSAAYHMTPKRQWKGWLRRCDQAAIFLKIAGTYTPFALLKMGGNLGLGLFGSVWVMALAGVGMTLSMRNKRRGFVIALYLGLGWAGVVLLWPLMMSMSALAFGLLGAGGVLYTLGVIFHAWQTLPFSNVIWHIFVLVATICHYAAVFIAVLIDV